MSTTHPAGSGITSFTGRWDSRGFHKDGKVHSAAREFATSDENVPTLCGRTIVTVATVWGADSWPNLLTDRCANCARKRVLIDPPSHKTYGDAIRTFGYRYNDARALAVQVLGTDELELGSFDVESRTCYFRRATKEVPTMV